MSIGTRIIQLRDQKGLTQQELSHRTGLAASYLSRVENRRLEPRPQTLRKIAAALGVPISEIFQERPAQLGALQCLVTTSGKCILNLLQSGRGKKPAHTVESYSPHQLQLLRMANYLIQTADKRRLEAFDVVLGALLCVDEQKACNAARSRFPAAGGK